MAVVDHSRRSQSARPALIAGCRAHADGKNSRSRRTTLAAPTNRSYPSISTSLIERQRLTLREKVFASGLNRITVSLLIGALVLTALHHTDHILRVDHSGWPFRSRVTPFTYSLLAYPMIFFALLGSRRLYWWRWGALLAGTAFVLFAHTVVESPQMQFTMWAENRSLDHHESAGLENLPAVRSPFMGIVSVAIGMVLNVTAVVATVAMLARGLRLDRNGAVD